MFKCPQCGGSMYFSVTSQQLKCQHCGTMIKPYAYQLDNQADMRAGYQVTVYTCASCGAQLESPDDSIVSYCMYCGAEQILPGKIEDAQPPARIIPFQIAQKKCREKYRRETKNLLYLPDAFKDPDYLRRFVGVYIPYWVYEARVSGEMPVEVTTSRAEGEYIVERTYQAAVHSSGRSRTIAVDASGAFDDSIASHIAPYRADQERDFRPAYLAGFYADRPGDPSVYDAYIPERMAETIYDDLHKRLSSQGALTKGLDLENIRKSLPVEIAGRTEHLLPVWFLTWRKKDRVAYSIMNGQTGELSADLPVDARKYFLAVLALAAALFAVFCLLPSVTAPTALSWSAVLTLILMLVHDSQMKSLRDRENHVYDLAYSGKDSRLSPKEKEEIRARRQRKLRGPVDPRRKKARTAAITAAVILLWLAFLFLSILLFLPGGRREGFWYSFLAFVIKGNTPAGIWLMIVSGICLAVSFRPLASSIRMMPQLKERSGLYVQFLSFLSIAAAFLLSLTKSPRDALYYGGSILCLGACAWTSVALIQSYNLLVTRPVPSFFSRKGGAGDVED